MASSQEIAEFDRLLGQRIRELIPVQTVWAVCKSVDWDNKTMVATGQTDDLDYDDVSLGRGAEFKKPKPGTICLLGIEENNTASAYLIEATELDEFYIKTGSSELKIYSDGFIVKFGNENLRTVLNDFMGETVKLNKELQKVIVSAGVSPNVPILQAIEQATEQIKQRLNTILKE